MKKELLVLKRKNAKELNKIGWSNRKIARYLVVNKNSIGKWLRIDEDEIEVDQRGWKKGIQRSFVQS